MFPWHVHGHEFVNITVFTHQHHLDFASITGPRCLKSFLGTRFGFSGLDTLIFQIFHYSFEQVSKKLSFFLPAPWHDLRS